MMNLIMKEFNGLALRRTIGIDISSALQHVLFVNVAALKTNLYQVVRQCQSRASS